MSNFIRLPYLLIIIWRMLCSSLYVELYHHGMPNTTVEGGEHSYYGKLYNRKYWMYVILNSVPYVLNSLCMYMYTLQRRPACML